MNLNDRLETLEYALDKCPPGSSGWASERRYTLRRALTALAAEAFEEGHLAGTRDERDARSAARDWEDKHPPAPCHMADPFGDAACGATDPDRLSTTSAENVTCGACWDVIRQKWCPAQPGDVKDAGIASLREQEAGR